LQTEDLIDFYLPRDHKILRSNTIKNLLSFACHYQLVKNTFKGIGSCDIIPLSRLNDFEKLAKYYFVWHNPNSNKESSYGSKDSINYVVNEYIKVFQDKKARLMLPCNDKVSSMIQKLKHGWNYAIEIIVAYDTSKNIGLIVDGTNHALALYYLSLHKQTLLQELLKINNSINLCQMNSSQCRNIFSHDFAKLSLSSGM
jgi:hypothetical protein